MTVCSAGHTSSATDYCDTCGLPLTPPAPTTEVAPVAAPITEKGPVALVSPTQNCPQCGTTAFADALFCEACGYDYTTGSRGKGLDDAPTTSSPASAATPPAPAAAQIPVAEPVEASSEPLAEGVSEPTMSTSNAAPIDVASAPKTEAPALWVAELWVDPDWYADQEVPEAMPSVGLPEVVPLRGSKFVIGRASATVKPEIDCGSDAGVSRRHALLTTDSRRWWIEDLGSSNGTFVGMAGTPLPADPISAKREIWTTEQLYVGGWTRIVLRRATPTELDSFGEG